MPRYLFTSSSDTVGGLFLLDSGTGEARRILQGSYRGLTEGPDGCYYVVSGSRNRQDDPNLVHRAVIYRVRSSSWDAEPVTELPVGDAHDLRWIDGHFYLVGSVCNEIIRLDAECRRVDRMQIVEEDRDVCHVNCLMAAGGELYCSIFTLSPGERREKRLTGAWQNEGKILKLDYPQQTFEIVYEPLGQPHSLVPHGGAIYLAESHKSCVTRVEPGARTGQVLQSYPGFVRGLCFGPGEAVLGVSAIMRKDRKRFKRVSLLQRVVERWRPFAGILILDPETWAVRKRISLPGCEPYEIHALD